jgi:hypothetical protein
VIKTLFKADTISAFIDAIKSEIYNQSDWNQVATK